MNSSRPRTAKIRTASSATSSRSWRDSRLLPRRLGDCHGIHRRKAVAECIFRDRARHDELMQIIRATCLASDAAELESAEGLAIDERAGDLAVDVEIADAKFA